MNIFEINEMVELIKKTDDKEIREILLEGLRHQLTSKVPTNLYPNTQTQVPYQWGTAIAVPCGQNNTGSVWL